MSYPPCENQALNDDVIMVVGGGGRRNEPRREAGKNGGKRQFTAMFPHPWRRQPRFKPGPFVLIREIRVKVPSPFLAFFHQSRRQ
jgi:hypothetical protein